MFLWPRHANQCKSIIFAILSDHLVHKPTCHFFFSFPHFPGEYNGSSLCPTQIPFIGKYTIPQLPVCIGSQLFPPPNLQYENCAGQKEPPHLEIIHFSWNRVNPWVTDLGIQKARSLASWWTNSVSWFTIQSSLGDPGEARLILKSYFCPDFSFIPLKCSLSINYLHKTPHLRLCFSGIWTERDHHQQNCTPKGKGSWKYSTSSC